MNAFIVELENRPGTFAEMSEAIAARGVNALGFSLTGGGKGYAAIVASDEAACREALEDIKARYRELELLPIAAEHTPGQAAKVSRQLANAGVNIELWLPTGMTDGKVGVAIGVDDLPAARRAVAGYVVSQHGDLWPKAVATASRR